MVGNGFGRAGELHAWAAHLLPQAVVQYDLDHGLTTLLCLNTDVECEVSASVYEAGSIRDTLHACEGGMRSGPGRVPCSSRTIGIPLPLVDPLVQTISELFMRRQQGINHLMASAPRRTRREGDAYGASYFDGFTAALLFTRLYMGSARNTLSARGPSAQRQCPRIEHDSGPHTSVVDGFSSRRNPERRCRR